MTQTYHQDRGGFASVLPEDVDWQPGEYVSQVSAIGPLGLEYVDPGDDPRNS